MSQLMEGKIALVLGVANRWSIAYAIAHAFIREDAHVILTYQGDRQKQTVEELAADLKAHQVLPCDVTQDAQLDALANGLKGQGTVLNAVVHSIAFANREDLSRPFVETSRAGFALAQDVSAYSLVAVARATAPLMAPPGPRRRVGNDADLPGVHAGSGKLQRHGRRQSVARSFCAVPGGRPWPV